MRQYLAVQISTTNSFFDTDASNESIGIGLSKTLMEQKQS